MGQRVCSDPTGRSEGEGKPGAHWEEAGGRGLVRGLHRAIPQPRRQILVPKVVQVYRVVKIP